MTTGRATSRPSCRGSRCGAHLQAQLITLVQLEETSYEITTMLLTAKNEILRELDTDATESRDEDRGATQMQHRRLSQRVAE